MFEVRLPRFCVGVVYICQTSTNVYQAFRWGVVQFLLNLLRLAGEWCAFTSVNQGLAWQGCALPRLGYLHAHVAW